MFSFNLYSQDTTQSLAFKKNRPVKTNPYFYRPDLSYQLLQQFRLLQEANSGDALAQHELGIRLLLGEGMAADTAQAVKWIKLAADQNLSAAAYNYGILLMNGWGVDWNPFEAFRYFKLAASKGMPQAQYVTGILFTDNLVVSRNWEKAYYFINLAKENGYKVEDDVFNELSSKVRPSFIDSIKNGIAILEQNISHDDVKSKSELNSSNQTSVEKSLGLSFINFDVLEDTTQHEIKEEELIKDLTRIEIASILDTLRLNDARSIKAINGNDQIRILMDLCNYGSPEALTLVGKLYEEGIYFNKDIITAAEYYIRAVRYESFRAPLLLYQLTQKQNFNNLIQREIANKNAHAMFVWYGLSRFGYNNELVINEAFRVLQSAAGLKHIPSMIELGLNYFTGDYLQKNESAAFNIWKEAEQSGSIEATIRIVVGEIFKEQSSDDRKRLVSVLINFAEKGSVIAQSALGICYLKGIGTNKNKALAVKYFRLAAFRGNRFAYEQLKNLYDEIRPVSPEFIVN
ncbi:TPR repeat protein [Ignavibacterium album JCM 16511]|uniref:TPR repeat protein n=1 Tax=Ignavibacterium album (strain DSM 19864 / JCM 16511 / NBRC 101810 / Mat9-16) TaxID=945713 RepID=I0AKQ7_IGNAJ|nr:TPR repeat protein [Ignavibacterium album JCM 16511]